MVEAGDNTIPTSVHVPEPLVLPVGKTRPGFYRRKFDAVNIILQPRLLMPLIPSPILPLVVLPKREE